MAGRLSIVYPGSQAEEGFDERWQGRVAGSQVAKLESSWAIGTIDVRGLYQWVIYIYTYIYIHIYIWLYLQFHYGL